MKIKCALIKYCFVIAVILATLLTSLSCSTSNVSPPEYVKDVVALKEGTDGITIYFVLADNTGTETAAAGDVRLRIVEERGSYLTDKYEVTLYETSFTVKTSDFQKAKIGIGAFERERLIYYYGRISYDEFWRQPWEDFATDKVIIEFTTENGSVLKGEDTIFF